MRIGHFPTRIIQKREMKNGLIFHHKALKLLGIKPMIDRYLLEEILQFYYDDTGIFVVAPEKVEKLQKYENIDSGVMIRGRVFINMVLEAMDISDNIPEDKIKKVIDKIYRTNGMFVEEAEPYNARVKEWNNYAFDGGPKPIFRYQKDWKVLYDENLNSLSENCKKYYEDLYKC